MKRFKIDTILFIIIISILGISNLLNFDKPSISKLENRALKRKPQFSLAELFRGSYLKDFEEYYSDTFILRDNLLKINRDLRYAIEFLGSDISLVTAYEDIQMPEEKDDEYKVSAAENAELLHPETAQSITDGKSTPSQTESSIPKPKAEEELKKDFGDGKDVGYWLVVDGKAVQLFKFNKENFEYYSQVLNKFSEKLGSNVKIYSMIPPTAANFMILKRYKGITDSQNDALAFLKSKLDENISFVNVYDPLNEHKEEYIYFRTDHHWTALGAYYAYASLMKTMGEEPVALEQYETINLGDYLGSSYTKTLDKSLEKNPDNVVAYKPFTDNEYFMYSGTDEKKADIIDMKYADDIKNKYLAFMSTGGATWSVVKTDVNNGKKIMVVKDSFGNVLIPFLLPHYEEIYVVDARFYSKSVTGKNIVQFIEDKGINELLFVIYMEDVNWHKFMQGVENLLGS
ncbi:DHHW family protein [Lutispora saccharofermentans]|uniref:DHHW protein n=1 Tax=Lutispora saccharofermentans TaxID=3024236 RepID=A0ABT1NHC0_9FIRM|nr:DHHW family protein [Lutispora saccharofermentans]MCQ1530678.1 hypothetical protein [Lutispora saccharofermentans]